MPRIETVKIAVDNARCYIIINKSDLTKEHKLFKPKLVNKRPAKITK